MADYNPTVMPETSAEERIRTWALSLEVDELLEGEETIAELEEQIHPYVAISRNIGSGGAQVAQRASEMLGWPVVDKDLLDCLAERYKLPRDMVKFVDEKTSHWLVEGLRMWMGTCILSETDYVMQVARFMLMAARHTSTIFVGRGSQFTLPRNKGLSVLIAAPLDQRIDRIMQRKDLPRTKAKRYAATEDAKRRDYLKKHFHRNAQDVNLYDLVINTERIDPDRAAEIIVRECGQRFGCELKPPTGATS